MSGEKPKLESGDGAMMIERARRGDGDSGVTARDHNTHTHIQHHDSGDEDADADAGALRPPPKKRKRTVISCTECHRRKQKCDRKLPCTNCVSRHKQHGCKYEAGATTVRGTHGHEESKSGAVNSDHPRPPPADMLHAQVANFGYSQTGASTLGFLQKLESSSPGGEPLSRLNPDDDAGRHDSNHFNTRERYKTLIRQLPARTYIDKLVDIYFVEFNWQYQGLDRGVFDRQLEEWYNLPFHQLNNGGPQALDPNLRAFPALLFQVLAIALLLLHPESDSVFESLKYAGTMSFDDLAVDYSQSGMDLLALLGKRQMTMTTVLSGFLRGSFLKYTAQVTESWHAIGSTIRDAQEVGIHRDSLDPKPPAEATPAAVLENQWEIQRRRRLWITLVWWDLHTAVVLGRPTTIDHFTMTPPTLPIDAKIDILAKYSSSSPTIAPYHPPPLVPRTESDPPTPLTRLLFAYALSTQLLSVLLLDKESSSPPSTSLAQKIASLHAEFLSIESRTPAWLRLSDPDTSFDSHPQCYWLPYARAQTPQLLAFNLMALHRPYIFVSPRSRAEALTASLGMLQAQRYHFSTLRPHMYKMFSLFFGTFDAVVLVGAVYILWQKPAAVGGRSGGAGGDDREEEEEGGVLLRESARRHLRWARERFEAMSARNALARAALGVVRAVEGWLARALGTGVGGEEKVSGGGNSRGDAIRPPATVGGLMPLPWAEGEGPAVAATVRLNNMTIDGGSMMSMTFTPAADAGGGGGSNDDNNNWDFNTVNLPSNFDWSTVQPIYATGYLLYHDLQMVNSSNTAGGGGGGGGIMGTTTTMMTAEGGKASDVGMMMNGSGRAGNNDANVWPATAGHVDDMSGGYNGNGNGNGNDDGRQGQADELGQDNHGNAWLFEGDFGNDSVWSLFNQFGQFQ